VGKKLEIVWANLKKNETNEKNGKKQKANQQNPKNTKAKLKGKNREQKKES